MKIIKRISNENCGQMDKNGATQTQKTINELMAFVYLLVSHWIESALGD